MVETYIGMQGMGAGTSRLSRLRDHFALHSDAGATLIVADDSVDAIDGDLIRYTVSPPDVISSACQVCVFASCEMMTMG
jgi:hypothetical protein